MRRSAAFLIPLLILTPLSALLYPDFARAEPCVTAVNAASAWSTWVATSGVPRLRPLFETARVRYAQNPQSLELIRTMSRDGNIVLDSFGLDGWMSEFYSNGTLNIRIPSIHLQTDIRVRDSSSTLNAKFVQLLDAVNRGIDERVVQLSKNRFRVDAVEITAREVVNPALAKMLTDIGFVSKQTGKALTAEEIESVLVKGVIPDSLSPPSDEPQSFLSRVFGKAGLSEKLAFNLVLRAEF